MRALLVPLLPRGRKGTLFDAPSPRRGKLRIARCVVANFVSRASPQAGKLARSVAPPFSRKAGFPRDAGKREVRGMVKTVPYGWENGSEEIDGKRIVSTNFRV